MSERKPTRFEMRLSPDLADRIDAWRRTEDDLPPRAEAARRAIESGLAARDRDEAVRRKFAEFDRFCVSVIESPSPKDRGAELIARLEELREFFQRK